MIEKGRISSLQMAILMYPTIIATAILLVPGITGIYAEQDMWLSPIWASIAGIFTVYIAAQLNKIYPRQTIIQYSQEIVGRIPGKLVGLAFLFFYFHSNGIILREYGEFIVGNFLPTTPMVIIIGSMTLVCGISVHGGLEVMARSAQVFVPLVTLLFIIIIILLLPELEPENMLPVFEKGIMPSITGAAVPAGWFMEFFLITFMLPYLNKRKKGMKWGMITVLSVMITLFITNLVSLFLFGDITSTFTYPIMEAARYISIADFLQHLESIVMAIWVAGTFIKISVFYYAIVIGAAQWLNLSDYRPIVFPIGLLLTAMGMWVATNLQELEHLLITIYPFYSAFVQMLIPTLLLLLAIIRKRTSKDAN